MRNKNGSIYRFNLAKLNSDYLLSVANYHNNSVISKINGKALIELSGFTGSETCFDLPDIINRFPDNTELTIECFNNGKQSFWNIFDSLHKKGELTSSEIPVNTKLGSKKFHYVYYLKNIDKHVVIDDGNLYVVTQDKSNLIPVSEIGFDVDEGFYSTVDQHPHADIIAELQKMYVRFQANNGLTVFIESGTLFNLPSEKQLEEFYKKEFGGTLFAAQDSLLQSSEAEFAKDANKSPQPNK